MPIHFLWGEEDYLIEKEVKNLKKEVLGESSDALNYRVLDNPDFATFVEALRATAMFFGQVFYLIKCDKYFLESKGKSKLDDKQTLELIGALENVAQGVHIVLVCPIARNERKKPDSRKKLYKTIAKLTKIKEYPAFKAYEEYKIAPVLKEMAKEKEITLGSDVVSILIQLSGTSLRNLDTQLEKLKLSAYPKKQIDVQSVRDICFDGEDIFALPDLILQKDYMAAISEITKILQKSHYLEVLGFLQTSFLKLLQTKLYSKTQSSMDISRKTGQHEFIVKKNLEKLKNISFEELLRLKINLTDAEYRLKSGQIEPLCAFSAIFFGGAK